MRLNLQPLLCHPEERPVKRAFRAVCPSCGSYWDLEACFLDFDYTESYPAERLHHDPEIGALKVSTLDSWFSIVGLDPREHVVCEVGFGGGFCLAHLHGRSQEVYGIEAIPANIHHAQTLGIEASRLFLFDQRPEVLPTRVSLWLFQDSFEHILEPGRFLRWVVANSSDRALLLIVAPNAASLSQRLLGRLWPHKLADHVFHWSARGLSSFLHHFGFRLRRRFNPMKHVSTDMVLNHLERTSLRRASALLKRMLPPMRVWFNMGEMGMLFERAYDDA